MNPNVDHQTNRCHNAISMDDACSIFSHLWNCISGEKLKDQGVSTSGMQMAARRRAQTLMDEVQNDGAVVMECLRSLLHEPIGYTMKFNRQSKLLMQAVNQVIDTKPKPLIQTTRHGRPFRRLTSKLCSVTRRSSRVDASEPKPFVPKPNCAVM